MAREKGVSAYLREGFNRWPAVRRLDPAHLFRLAGKSLLSLNKCMPRNRGSHRPQFKVQVVNVASEEAAKHFAWFAHFAAIGVPAYSCLSFLFTFEDDFIQNYILDI